MQSPNAAQKFHTKPHMFPSIQNSAIHEDSRFQCLIVHSVALLHASHEIPCWLRGVVHILWLVFWLFNLNFFYGHSIVMLGIWVAPM